MTSSRTVDRRQQIVLLGVRIALRTASWPATAATDTPSAPNRIHIGTRISRLLWTGRRQRTLAAAQQNETSSAGIDIVGCEEEVSGSP